MVKLPVYLDFQATTPVDPQVLQAMLPYFQNRFGNAASRSHEFGWTADAAVEKARKQVARFIGSEPGEVVFTSGATESINLALIGAAEAAAPRGRHIITTSVEHSSAMGPCKYLASRGFNVTFLPVDQYGFVSAEQVRAAITPETILISVMTANNEVGTLFPIAEIGQISKQYGITFHTDATQAMGKIPIDVNALQVDLLSLSAHKIYGPKGVGALFVRRKNPRVQLHSRALGGEQENGLRAGTVNVPGIVGLGEAADLARVQMSLAAHRIRVLRDRLWNGIKREIPDAVIHGPGWETRLPDNLSVAFPGIDAQVLMSSTRELAVSAGSACLSGSLEPSYVLQSMGVSEELARSTIRLSVGRPTLEEEVDYAILKLSEMVQKFRALQRISSDEISKDSVQHLSISP